MTPEAENNNNRSSFSENTTSVKGQQVLVNELLPSPSGPDDKEEWVEIYNSSPNSADISGWKLKDTKGKITTYTFPGKTVIPAKGFLLLPRPVTKITLNNDADGLVLLSVSNETADTVNYEKAPTGKSYNRFPASWAWSKQLTPEAENVLALEQPKLTLSATPNASPSIIPQVSISPESAPPQINSASAPLSLTSLLCLAIAFSLACGIAFLAARKRLTKE